MLSHGLIGVPHLGQADAGKTMDLPEGIRRMQTLRKLPIARPKAKAIAPKTRTEAMHELCHSETSVSRCDDSTVPEC